MDSSSAIQPEASTVHRPASTGSGAGGENEDLRGDDAASLEGAETVIRQDPRVLLDDGQIAARKTPTGPAQTPAGMDVPSGEVGREQGRELPPSPSGDRSGGKRSWSEGRSEGSSQRIAAGSGSSSLAGPTHQTPASLTRELAGQRLNHFELLEQIGGGGMGAVFRAVDERLGRTVAVKVVPFAAGDPDLQRRFRNEAQSAAKLDHPLIARVFEVGNDGPWYYIVFEYIDGSNIRDVVSQNGPLSLDDAVYYTCQVAEAIGHASRRGIVHRDIKPSNVVVTEERSIKLVDMGLARSESFETSEDMTASGVTLGTFDYISPEQAHDPRLADIRSDLYSLGCTFYYMLTGVPPYPGGTMLQKLLNHGNAAIPDIRDRCEDASDDLAAILRKMLAKQPEQRYQDSQSLIADLRELALREDLRRSRGVNVVTVDGDSMRLRRLLQHLPWVVAVSVLAASAIGLELFSWQQRGDFSSQVAATIPDTALESVPVTISTPRNESSRPDTPIPFASVGTDRERGANSQAGGSNRAANPSAIIPRDSGPIIGNLPFEGDNPPNTIIPGGYVPPNFAITPPNFAAAAPGVAMDSDASVTRPLSLESEAEPRSTMRTSSEMSTNLPRDPSRGETNPANMPAVSELFSGTPASDSASVGNPNSQPPSLIAPSEEVGTTSSSRTTPSRLPSDPPSLRNFPLPIGSDTGPETDPRMTVAPSIPSFVKENSVPTDQAAISVEQRTENPLVIPGDNNRTMIVDPPHSVRIVSADTLFGLRTIEDAQREGVVLATSFADALKLARQHRVERIEIDTPMLTCDPVIVEEDDLVISSTVPGGTAVVFNSNREVDMQRSDMLTIGRNRIELVDLHLYWTVPANETDGGAMIAMNDSRQVRLTDCSITIDNPSRRENVHAFNIVTDPEAMQVRDLGLTRAINSGASVPTSLPLVSLELYNVIIRGQISMLQMDVAAELQLLWENGLLAVSRRMIETGGSLERPQPMSGSIRLSLQRLTAYVPRGLLLMRLGVSTPYPVAIERQAEESVFVVDRGVPQVEISGISREDRDLSWLRIRGASNAYEADTTLSDPMLVVRDQNGQTITTTMNDLIDRKPDWADDRTPRWVVRWSQPLPESVPVSRLIPADFRQDGSLFAGFQEKSLPKMPMQRTLDIPASDTR